MHMGVAFRVSLVLFNKRNKDFLPEIPHKGSEKDCDNSKQPQSQSQSVQANKTKYRINGYSDPELCNGKFMSMINN